MIDVDRETGESNNFVSVSVLAFGNCYAKNDHLHTILTARVDILLKFSCL